MKDVIIFGGTGFIGLSLAQHLQTKGFKPILIARSKPKHKIPFTFKQWDAETVGDWKDFLEGAAAIVNLAGKSVDCIKTPANCDLILRSRVNTTLAIGEALKTATMPPKVWVQMSTAHIYGDPPKTVCTEESTTGYGLAPFVGKAWEETFLKVLPNNIRGVRLRTSFVVGKNGGALKALKRIVKLGLGGTAGNGQQGMSWLHEFDMNEIIHQAIINESYNGFYIASAPKPVSNEVFMKKLRTKMKMPFGLFAPEFTIRFGAKYFFKTDPELILYGRYVYPKRLLTEAYAFKFATLEEALDDLV